MERLTFSTSRTCGASKLTIYNGKGSYAVTADEMPLECECILWYFFHLSATTPICWPFCIDYFEFCLNLQLRDQMVEETENHYNLTLSNRFTRTNGNIKTKHIFTIQGGGRDNIVVSTVTSKQEGFWFEPKLGPCCVEFVVWVSSCYAGLLPQSKNCLNSQNKALYKI